MYDIRAGTPDELKPQSVDSVDWFFVDVGFSSTDKSCGVLKIKEKPKTMKFGCLVKCVVKEVQTPGKPAVSQFRTCFPHNLKHKSEIWTSAEQAP